MSDAIDLPTFLLGLEGFRLLAAETTETGELVVTVETTTERTGCPDCGVIAGSNGRPEVAVRDLPIAGRPTILVWKKREFICREQLCPKVTWRETTEQVRPRRVLTERARWWAVRRVGKHGTSVAQVARDLGVAWHTVNDAVVELGRQLIAADDRLEHVQAVGVDEHNVLRGHYNAPACWATAIVDLDRGRLLDVVENRTADAVRRWFGRQPASFIDGIEQAALDPYQGYATALEDALDEDTTIVVDHFHLVRLANQMVDEARRRTQRETLGHRGRKGDPLYDIRRLLLVARGRLDDWAIERIREGLDEGDRWLATECAWIGKELVRDVYAADSLAAADRAIEEFLDWAGQVQVPEVSKLARTVTRWRIKILAYHRRQLSNGRTEAMNMLVKKIKRVGHGFRNFRNYRIRLLLHCGVKWNDPPTASIRGPEPAFAA